MRSIVVTEYGSTDSLELRETETPEPTPGEVRIDIEAAGISFADIMQRRGTYRDDPEPLYAPGMEAVGIIDTVGEDADREVGERVVTVTGGGTYARSVTTPAPTLFDVPEPMSSAGTIDFPVQFLATYNCLHEWGDPDDDERVLIQAAAGGIDTTTVQLAFHTGVGTFGAASAEAKLDLTADLSLDHGIQYTEEDFREVVVDETDGAGVNLALDGIGGETFRRSLDALAGFGRLVTYGVASDDMAGANPTRLLFENKSATGLRLGSAVQRHPGSILGAVPELSELLTADELDMVIGEMFTLEDAVTAHEYIEVRKSNRKVVLEP